MLRELMNMSKKIFICLNCKQEYFSRKENSKVCSIQCKHDYNRVEHLCDCCGKTHIVYKNVYEKYKNGIHKNLYCSRECANKGLITSMTKKCLYCGSDFTVENSIKDIQKFCSMECYCKYRNLKVKYETKICKECNKEFKTYHHNQKYCSYECSSKANQKRDLCLCDNCGKTFYRIKSEVYKNKKHFCSKECMYEFMRWSEKDIEILRKHYRVIKNKDIQQMLSKQYSIQAIRGKAQAIGLGKSRLWTHEEEDIVYKLYDKIPMNQLLKLLPNRTYVSILHKARSNNLSSYFYTSRTYSIDDIKYLSENYLEKTNEELARKLGRSPTSIAQKLWNLNLYRPMDIVKDGYKNLNNFVRARLHNWKAEVRELNNYTCCITGEHSNLIIHHCKSFNLLMQETIDILNFEIKDSFSEYTDEELNCFLDTFLNLQSYYNEYVCITETIHKLFHKHYGYGDNTMEQWNEFVERYKNNYYSKIA